MRLLHRKTNNKLIVSKHIQMDLQNNMLAIGAAGTGKSMSIILPNILQMNSSFVVIDPKGEYFRHTRDVLDKNGYQVKTINLLDTQSSNCYNPFAYLHEEKDVHVLAKLLLPSFQDEFLGELTILLLESLLFYVWLEEPIKNLSTVLYLLHDMPTFKCKLKTLDKNHFAVQRYEKYKKNCPANADIVLLLQQKLAKYEFEPILQLLDHDDLSLSDLGFGVESDGKTKTALFFILPTIDSTYYSLFYLLYSQIMSELLYCNTNGNMPIHVSFLLDEFANLSIPDDYSFILNMSMPNTSTIICIQALSQLQKAYPNTWELICTTSDVIVCLGGYSYQSQDIEMICRFTKQFEESNIIETYNKQQSMSKCLVFIDNEQPIFDDKYQLDKKSLQFSFYI